MACSKFSVTFQIYVKLTVNANSINQFSFKCTEVDAIQTQYLHYQTNSAEINLVSVRLNL